MGIYNVIYKNNKSNQNKLAVSITMDSGQKRAYTYSELFQAVDRYVAYLETYGVLKGDRIVIVSENVPEWNIAFLAIMKLKCTAVLIDASLTKEEILDLVEKSDARGIYISPKVMSRMEANAWNSIPVMDLVHGGEIFSHCTAGVSKQLPRTIDGDENIAVIIYSSGTTRSAAGIMHTHEAMIQTIEMTMTENHLTHEERILSVLPNSHIYGIITGLLGSMMLGASLYYIDSLNNENVIRAFKECQPTVFPCVPKVFELFEKQIVKKIQSKVITRLMYQIFFPICNTVRRYTGVNLGRIIFKSIHKGFGGCVKIMTSAGAPLEEQVAEFYYGTGFNLLITYGLTETNIPVIGNRDKNLTTNSCGKPYPHIEIKLAHPNENGNGEIYVKSPYMMKGYFRDKASTEEAFEGEWFKTGDLGTRDEKGNIKITGRSKENIVLATGKKITPTDVEGNYMNIPGVKEFVVCGVPAHGTDYDEVHAFIVKENDYVSSEEILKVIQERGSKLSLYMKIVKVHFMEEIPKTSLQKPKRFLLKKHALEGFTELVEESEETPRESFESIEKDIEQIVVRIAKLDSKMVRQDSKIFADLGVDSLAAIEISIYIEEKYGVSVDQAYHEAITIGELAAYVKSPKEGQAFSNTTTLKKKKVIHYYIFKASSLLARLIYKVRVKGVHNIPNHDGYIICANHVSNIDYLWVTMPLRKEAFLNFCCMAKKELFNSSFASKLLVDVCGMIPVDRGGINSQVIKSCKKQLQDGWALLIHPEGTRSHNGELGCFKKGAASIAKEANVPIIPVYIKGAHEIYPRGNKMPKLFDWKNMSRYEVEVIYGEPIYSQDLSAEELIQVVEKSIIKLQ